MVINKRDIRYIIKSVLNEVLAEDGEDFGVNVKGDLTINDIEKGVPLYHRPKDASGSDPLAVIKSLMKYGFSREYTGDNGGNMYGPGVYNVYELRSSNEKARGYGKYIVKSYLLGGYKNFLIFNEDIAKSVYGRNWWIGDQIKLLFPDKIASSILHHFNGRLYMNTNHTSSDKRTSNIAVAITDFLGSKIAQSKVRGILYSGGHDGCCAFVRNFSDVIPYAYSADNGKTWVKAITDELIWRAGHDTDVEANLRHTRDNNGKKAFDDVADRSINGFVITYKGNKANYFDVANNKLISDIWFDYAGNFNEYGEAEVSYEGNKYTLQKEGNQFVVIDDDMGPLCYLPNLPENIFENKNLCCESVLLTESTEVDNFQWVEKFIEQNNPTNEWGDNFYYITIQQRKKDNDIKERVRYIRTYEIFSAEQLHSLEKEIKFYCQRYNARAYILLNKRSLKTVEFYTDRDFKLKRHDGYERDFNSGRQLDIPERPIAHIDIDSEDTVLHQNVIKYLEDNGIDILYKYSSPNNGLHIVIPDKELVRAKHLNFRQFGSDVQGNKNNPMFDRVDMLADRPIILYANTQTKGYDALNQSYTKYFQRHN